MATTAPASPDAPSPSKAATTGWLAPADAAASIVVSLIEPVAAWRHSLLLKHIIE
jgi:hypothetical protein